MRAANAVIVFVASYNGKASKAELERFLRDVGELMAPCPKEMERARHEEAAVAAFIIDDDRVRLAAIEALFMHGRKPCLPVLRGMIEEATLSANVRNAAQMAYSAVAARCGEPGSVSITDNLAGAISR